MKIIAVALNPAIDVTLHIDTPDYGEPAFLRREQLYAGGKAVNVARVLAALGEAPLLTGLAGQDNLAVFRRMLEADGVENEFVSIPGSIRENLTICQKDGLLKINRPGFEVNPGDLSKVAEIILSCAPKQDCCLVFSGSFPPGYTNDMFVDFIRHIKTRLSGSYIVLDNSSLTIDNIKVIHPFLYKPNLPEFQNLFGGQVLSEKALYDNITMLSQYVDHLIVSRGSKGFLYANNGCIYDVSAPKVDKGVPVGAGDTLTACFLYSYLRDKDVLKAARYAAAGAAASVALDGTAVVTPEDIAALEPYISLHQYL